MSIDRGNVRGLVRAFAYDVKGSRLGRVVQVFLDDRTDEPAWVAVDVTRTRGMRLLPLAGAGLKGRHLVIRAERTTVRSAPRIDLGDGQLSSQDETRLLEHYGLVPLGGSEGAQTDERRPASPWPDDTERETAWERPAQQQHDGPDTQAISSGWDQHGDQHSGDQRHADQAPPTQQTAMQPPPPPQTAMQPAPTQQSPMRQSDTAPSPTVPAPNPPPEEEPTTASQARESLPIPPTTPDRTAEIPRQADNSTAVRPADQTVRPAEGSEHPAPRSDPESSGSRV